MSEPGPIVLFDGVCNLCSALVGFVLRHDLARRFRFAALQSEAGRRLLGQFGRSVDEIETLVLVDGDRCRVRSDAAIDVLVGLGGVWRLSAVARLVPRSLRDAVYALLARHRYAWFGKRAECVAPSPEIQSRFLA